MAAAAAAAHLTRVAGEANEERTTATSADGRISLLRRVGDVHAKSKEARLSEPQHFVATVGSRASLGCLWLCGCGCVRACQYGHRTDLPGPGELRNNTKPTSDCLCPFSA